MIPEWPKEQFASLQPETAQALARKLLAMADDELILAHRNSEWCGHAPILEEDIAFANIAQDELGHAGLWYGLLQPLDGSDPDRLVFFREASDYRNARMLELPNGDWAFSMLRQYLFDSYETVLLQRLVDSALEPLAQAAAKARREEIYHLRHTQTWVQRLGLGTEESRRRMQEALDTLWPYTAQLFLPLPGEERLVAANIAPSTRQLQARWRQTVVPFLQSSGLTLNQSEDGNGSDETASRERHTEHLPRLLEEMQSVARLDPEASW